MDTYSSPTVQDHRGRVLVLPPASNSFQDLLQVEAFKPAVPFLQQVKLAAETKRYPLQALDIVMASKLRGALREAMGLPLIKHCHLVSLHNPQQVKGRRLRPICTDFSLITDAHNLGPIPADCQAWRFYKCWHQLRRCHRHSKLFSYGIHNMWTLVGYYLGYLESGNNTAAKHMATVVKPCLNCLPLSGPDENLCMSILFA
jgi:hypothetical protein